MKLIKFKKLIKKFLNIFLESLPNKLKYRLKAKLRWIYSDKWGKKYFWNGGNYKWIFRRLDIKKNSYDLSNSIIIEIGSRDCLDAIELYEQFKPSQVFAFEPSRSGISRCVEVLKENFEISSKITLCGFALGEKTQFLNFLNFVRKTIQQTPKSILVHLLFLNGHRIIMKIVIVIRI